MSFTLLLFYVLAFVAVASSVVMVGFTRELPSAVVCLLVMMASLACIYLLLGSPVVAAAQLVHVAAVAFFLRLAISRLGLTAGFTTRNFSEGMLKLVVGGAVLSIAIVFAIMLLAGSVAMAPGSDGAAALPTVPPAPASQGFLAFAVALVLLAAGLGVDLLARRRGSS
jgi:NADH:ubiquinone oxidoreductase subunit 6 (subunit J)